MSDTKATNELVTLQDLLHRRGWNMRTVKTFLDNAKRETDLQNSAIIEEGPLFPLARIEAVEATRDWKTQAENLEHKRERQRKREQDRWERERPTYLEVGKIDLGTSCKIVVPAFPGLQETDPDSTVYGLAKVEPLARGPWKVLVYKVQGKSEERLTFSLFAFAQSLVPVDFDGEVTDEQIRDLYPFLIPTWEPSLFEEDPETAFKTVEGERIPWERIWGPQRLPYRLLALINAEAPEESLDFLEEMNALYLTTRRKRKNTVYSTFVREGYKSLSGGCAVPAGGADGVEGIFVHRDNQGLIEGIWIDMDISESRV